MPTLVERLQSGWNAFKNADTSRTYRDYGVEYSYRQDRTYFSRGNKQSIVSSIYNQISIDCAQIPLIHARVDEDGRYISEIHDGLDECLRVQANIDQDGRAFIQDVVQSMLDEGTVAIVPIVTDIDPLQNGGFDVRDMRTGRIKSWYPRHVRVEVYDDRQGRKKELVLPKTMVALVENPLYAIMNEPNSTLQRLIRKMNLLDRIDEQNGSGKLDLIFQLPYSIRSVSKMKEARARKKDLEDQLANSKYGVAYIDATEKVTQLNRSLENNLLEQIKDLRNTLYAQLGLTEEVFNGTADEAAMINYYNRTIEPIMAAIANEMKRKFLTKTARTRGQSIVYIRDPFKLVPVSQLAEIADKFLRNQILSSNEFRSIVGYTPVDNEKADELRNPNLNEPTQENGERMDYPNTKDQKSSEGQTQKDDGANDSKNSRIRKIMGNLRGSGPG